MLGSVAMVIGDRDARLVVQTALECAGYECAAFSSTPGLLRGLKREDTRLVIIDIDESLVDWRVVVDWRRNWLNPSVGLIAVGAANGSSTAAALNGGVDDYVSRPIHGPELLARISAVSRRSGAVAVPGVALAGCEIDRTAGALRSERGTVGLTSREMGIAQLLFEQVGHVVTRQRLASEVWASSPELIGHSIEQHIYQLRRKLERCVGKRLVLRSIYGHGYRLEMIGAVAPCKPWLDRASNSPAAVVADAA
jgi:DNA-binding response OmpR family regulator